MKRKTDFVKARKAQVSAEMILLIAAVLAVALILVSQMQEAAKQGAKAVQKNAEKVFKEINETAGLASGNGKYATGEECTRDSQCESGKCDEYLKVCK